MHLDRLIGAKEKAYQAVVRASGASRNPFVSGRHYAGVGIGHKNGDPKGELCVRYYVRRKLDPNDVPPSHLIEGTTDGIMTDVVETGALIGYGGAAAAVAAPSGLNPATVPGSGICYMFDGVQGPYGTVAAVLADGQGNRYALSGNHVLARNGAPLRRPGFHVVDTGLPGPVVPPAEPIGTAITFASLGDGSTVDCAMVKAEAAAQLRQLFPPPLGPVSGAVAEPDFQRKVRKFGYISRLTEGTVLDQFANIRIDFGAGLGLVHFTNAALIVSASSGGTFATQGDSGSLVVQLSSQLTKENREIWDPMGLVVGGTQADVGPGHSAPACVFVCPLSQVLAQLNGRLDPLAGPLALAPPD